ncbi:hypothetical protein [Streptosporangium sp. NPDC001681]|uniref:hypothetical protein n=1 Tax=Streptosporangium sp. NPDC001681 TaxID=3154395 RepID=UPI00331FCC09
MTVSMRVNDPSIRQPRKSLYHGEAVAYCCSGAGLRPTDARAIVGQADMWLRLPEHHWRR